MAKLQLVTGTTSYIAQVFIQDSSSTTGAGLTGLTNASSGLTAYYHRDTDTTATAISLVTMTVGTFTSSGFKEIDSTNMPGWYQLCPPNAALASGAKSCGIHLKGATNMAPLPLEIELTATNNQDAVHGGFSCLPNTAVTTNASLLTSGTGTDQLSVASGRIDIGKALGNAVTTAASGVLDVNAKNLGGTAQTGRDIGASVLLSAGTGTGQLDFTSGVVKANLAQILGTALTETAGQIAVAFKKLFDVASPVFTATSVNQTGDSYARLGAPAGASVSADIAAIKSDSGAVKTQTDKLTFTVANQVDSNVLDWKSATAPAMTGDAFARLGAPAGASVSADIAALPTATSNADALLKRDMSAVTGEAARSPLNAFRFLRNLWQISGGTLTVTKEDDTTTAWTGAVTTTAGNPVSKIDPA